VFGVINAFIVPVVYFFYVSFLLVSFSFHTTSKFHLQSDSH